MPPFVYRANIDTSTFIITRLELRNGNRNSLVIRVTDANVDLLDTDALRFLLSVAVKLVNVSIDPISCLGIILPAQSAHPSRH